MKSKNMKFKIPLSLCAVIALVSLFLPLISLDVVIFDASVTAFNCMKGDGWMMFAGEGDITIFRIMFGIMILLQVGATLLLWLIRNKAKLVLSIVAGLYETGLGILFWVAAMEDGAIGIGTLWMLLAGVVQLIVSIAYLIKGGSEKEAGAADASEGRGSAYAGTPGGKLIAQAGDFAGASFPIGEDMVMLGRDSSVCGIVLVGNGISRQHCGVRYDAAKREYHVFDYSSNGTFLLSGQRLQKGENVLQPGNAIKVGDNVFVLE